MHGDYSLLRRYIYFNVSDIDKFHYRPWYLYIDTVADKVVYTDETALRFNGRTDRLYTEPQILILFMMMVGIVLLRFTLSSQ